MVIKCPLNGAIRIDRKRPEEICEKNKILLNISDTLKYYCCNNVRFPLITYFSVSVVTFVTKYSSSLIYLYDKDYATDSYNKHVHMLSQSYLFALPISNELLSLGKFTHLVIIVKYCAYNFNGET